MSMLPTLRITLAGLTRFDLGAGHNLSYEELCTILHEAPFLKLLDIYWPRTTLSDSKKVRAVFSGSVEVTQRLEDVISGPVLRPPVSRPVDFAV